MRNHEILERHENEESCGQSIARHGASLLCGHLGSELSFLLYFRVFRFFVVNNPGYGEPHSFRPDGLSQELVDEIDFHFSGLTRGQEPLARCLWFDPLTRQCQHYEYRPQVCIDYELGGRACLSRRREAVQNGEPFPVRGDGHEPG